MLFFLPDATDLDHRLDVIARFAEGFSKLLDVGVHRAVALFVI